MNINLHSTTTITLTNSPLSQNKATHTRRKKLFKTYACNKHNQNKWVHEAKKLTHFCGKNVELLRENIRSRVTQKLSCVNQSFYRSSISPLWNEGLLLFRASVFVAVISGVCLLLWYGQNKVKGYIENRVLPSVCSMLSETIQREVDFGKVRRISPLSITLEGGSMGPHSEEFSCGEVPMMKLRLRPFSSLRRGKIVVDAVLSRPTLLVAQKKDYSWLGIPYSEGGVKGHLSTEEGIDYRTKTRRLVREEAAARWDRERDLAAQESAEFGYVVSEKCSEDSESVTSMQHSASTGEFMNSGSVQCGDKKMHWRDQHCTDAEVEYDTKHANLEKSFGMKVPGSGFKFWSRVMKGPKKFKFMRKTNGNGFSSSSIGSKRRILDRSALAAVAYFRNQSNSKSSMPSQSAEGNDVAEVDSPLMMHEGSNSLENSGEERLAGYTQNTKQRDNSEIRVLPSGKNLDASVKSFDAVLDPSKVTREVADGVRKPQEKLQSIDDVVGTSKNSRNNEDIDSGSQNGHTNINSIFKKHELSPKFPKNLYELFSNILVKPVEKMNSETGPKVNDIVAELVDGVDFAQTEGLEKKLPVIVDSVYFKAGTLMLLAYGDREARQMENVNGYVRFQNHYRRVHVQLSGNCKMWRSEMVSEEGGWLSTDVFVDMDEQKWHANLKIAKLFVPLFERILEIPITWSRGRATGEVHICMSRGETFPNLHGELDVTGLEFQIYDSPSSFHDVVASLCFRGQRIFLHNANGFFGNVPLEASGDFGIHPDEGEFHLMCQVPSVEINSLMKTFKMKPLLFPLAGSVTAVFNCQGPLDAPIFVGSGLVSRNMAHEASGFPASAAYEAMSKSKDAGAVAALDRVPFSYVSANFTFNTDNCVADLYGIRASLVDGGEIRGAGNAWICSEGEMDDTAIDVNFSGNLFFDKVMNRYIKSYLNMMPCKLGQLSGETKLSGSLLRPRFDIKWMAPTAEGSFNDARGDITISHDHITINSSSVAFELYTKIKTSYLDEYRANRKEARNGMPFVIEGVELDLRMRGFEFFSLVSSYPYPFDSPRPVHLKATGRIKFLGKVLKADIADKNTQSLLVPDKEKFKHLAGDVSISGLKLNQLMLGPQLVGLLEISPDGIKMGATGRPDESLALEFAGPLLPTDEKSSQEGRFFSFNLQKGQLRANLRYRPHNSADLEVRHLPLDELELASLRGTVQKAEVQLNLRKRRGYGMLSVLQPKFSGILGEALDIAVRWSGDVITVEKTVLEQSHSWYEIQGEYVLPGTRDQSLAGKKGGLLERAMAGHLGSVISSMGRWRMRLEVPRAEVAEMLPLARLLSRSTDPAVRSRSKDFFIQNLPSVGLCAENLRELLQVIHDHYTSSNEVVFGDFSLPGLAELKGHWHGSLDASGGGNGDTMAEFDFHGEDWEWGSYQTQRVVAVGAYSNDDGLRLERIFIKKDDATVHADGTLLGPKTNLHFAVLNFPVNLVPTLVQVFETKATDVVHSLRQLLAPIKGILHMEGDLRGSLAKPECDVQVRLLDGAVGGIDLGRAEIVASLTSTSRFLFNAKCEPVVQNGHVHIQGSVPVTFAQDNIFEEEDREMKNSRAARSPDWIKERREGSADATSEKKVSRARSDDSWNTQLAESLKGLNWNILDVGEVRVDADIKDGGMLLLTALSPYANWLYGNADIGVQVRGTVEQPVLDGFAYFHRASISSPVLRKPLTNFGGTVHVKSNRLCISSLEGRVSRRGKLFVKGSLPLRTSEASPEDKIDLKCDVLEVRAKSILSGQVDTQMQIRGSILQPNISGDIILSRGEAYLPHDKGSAVAPVNSLESPESQHPGGIANRIGASRYVSRFVGSESAASSTSFLQPSVKPAEEDKGMGQMKTNPKLDVRLSDLKLVLGPELRIVYPLILNFAVSGELELNGQAHPKLIEPRGTLAFESGYVNLVATQIRLKREHLNMARFEPEYGLDPLLDLALVGSEWQFRIQSRASNWQDNLVVTSLRSMEQDVLSPTEAARVLESQLAESILEADGQLAFKKLATATLERLMPRIEGKGEIGQARWRIVYAPQIPGLFSVDPTVDLLEFLASNISFGTEVEVQLGKRLQASFVRQMKDSEMAMQWTLIYQLTNRLRLLLQSAPSKRLLFEYSATSQN